MSILEICAIIFILIEGMAISLSLTNSVKSWKATDAQRFYDSERENWLDREKGLRHKIYALELALKTALNAKPPEAKS